MPSTKAKYHHLIPQTYMSAWALNRSGSLKVKYLSDENVVERNKENIAGVNHYHSIVAGMVICTPEDADILFKPVSEYIVTYDGRVISDYLELNRIYYDFENWMISRTDGTTVSKKKIKAEIDQIKIRDIEENWSVKYENKWGQIRQKIEVAVESAESNFIDAFEKDFLMKFYTALDWRSIKSNMQFDELVDLIVKNMMQLDKIDLPENDRILGRLDNAADEMRHCLLLKYYRCFLKDSGVIATSADLYSQNMSFHFLTTDDELFITSDNPAFIHTNDDGSLIGLLPITPRILMCVGKNSEREDLYYITKISNEDVRKYNEAICQNANEFIILN